MSLNAYTRNVLANETPQKTEERALSVAISKLREASGKTGPALVEALDFNRRLWQTFAEDCSLPANGLPPQLRASIISLSIWVTKHSSLVVRGTEQVDDLIEVNRSILEGLSAQGAHASGNAGIAQSA